MFDFFKKLFGKKEETETIAPQGYKSEEPVSEEPKQEGESGIKNENQEPQHPENSREENNPSIW